MTDAFKRLDAASYDPVSEAFDRLSERFSAPLADGLVQRAGLTPGQRVLDVGTGSGLVARRAAQGVDPGGFVLGIDLSEGMLALARARSDPAMPVEFRQMDAEALDLPKASFDVVLSLFALLHFPDPVRALREIHGVLRPSGHLVLGVGSPPPLFSVAALGRVLGRVAEGLRAWRGLEWVAPAALDRLVAERLPAGPLAEVTELEHHDAMKPTRVPALVRAAGFARVRVEWVGMCAEVDSPEQFWELQSTYSSRARKRLAAAPSDLVRGIREDFLVRAGKVRAKGGRLIYRSAALYVIAERPGSAGV